MRERNFRKLPSKKVIAVGIVCMLALGVALYFYLGHGSNNKKKNDSYCASLPFLLKNIHFTSSMKLVIFHFTS